MSNHTSDSISRETFAVDGRNELSGSRIRRGGSDDSDATYSTSASGNPTSSDGSPGALMIGAAS